MSTEIKAPSPSPASEKKKKKFSALDKYREAGPWGAVQLAWSDRQSRFWIIVLSLTVLLVYSYWNSLSNVAATWESAQYSHGFLIPIFAAVLLWLRREPIQKVPLWQMWVGCGLIVAGFGLRMLGTALVIFTFDHVSFVPCLVGVFVLAGGLPVLKWAGAPLAFLLFMFPLPTAMETNLLKPLQRVATISSCFALQTLGIECYREGNNIHLANLENPLGVVDQCSGLRMLTIFLALSVALAMLSTNRPWWERLVVVASAIPIAIVVNVIRITVTGLLFNLNVDSELAHKIFHDWAGYVMMPMAFGFLYLEMQILAHLIIETTEKKVVRAHAPVAKVPGKVPRSRPAR